MYIEEASVFRIAEMQIPKQIGTMIDVVCPVANLFPATEKDLCFTDCARSTGDEASGVPLINDSVTTVRVAQLLVSTGTIMMMMMIINC